MSVSVTIGNPADAAAIRPFTVPEVPQAELEALRARVAATRWPPRELVADRSQGVQLATIQELARYWTTDYDWRKCEASLNALPQFTTEIGGVDIHFVHVKSPREDALPLIITHGWPGSILEMLGVTGPLTDPAAHGGHAGDAFDLVIPSLPGYGFSGQPAEAGWDPGRIAQAWAELMRRLGYTRYVAQGGDQGAAVTDAMAGQAPGGLAGIHLNFLRQALASVSGLPADSEEERAAVAAISTFQTGGSGYFLEQATRPQTIGYALLDSPVALAAWMLDHDTDSYGKISRAFLDGHPAGNLTRDHILDNITLYWLTGTGPRPPARTGRADRPQLARPARLLSRSYSRPASPRSPARSSGPRAAGPRRSTPTSSTSTKPAGAATSPPGKSHNCSQKNSARASGRSAR
jgi:pimeloyl-ACP methyl ester carboxylesterase